MPTKKPKYKAGVAVKDLSVSQRKELTYAAMRHLIRESQDSRTTAVLLPRKSTFVVGVLVESRRNTDCYFIPYHITKNYLEAENYYMRLYLLGPKQPFERKGTISLSC